MLDESKSLRQEQGINIWKQYNFHGTLNYIMRFGKTRIIELIVSRTRQKNPSKRIVLLVPSEIAYRNIRYIEKEYNIECYTSTVFENSIDNGNFHSKDKTFILIIDEIHRFLTGKLMKYILEVEAEYHLGLTGSTLTQKHKSSLARIKFPVIDIITEEEAIKNNWISDYEEYNLAVDISDSDKKRIKYLSDNINNISDNFKGIYKRFNSLYKDEIFKGDFELLQSCYSGKNRLDKFGKYIEYISSENIRLIVATIQGYKKDTIITNDAVKKIQEFWHPDNIQEQAKSYIKAVKARNDYLKYNVSKVNSVLELSRFIDKPTIIYNESIDMIEHLSTAINVPNVKYHSDMESVMVKDENGEPIRYMSGIRKGEPKLFGKTYLKKYAIDSILNGTALYLITGKSLNESLNLPNIEYIICTSGDTNPMTYEQRVARGKTIDMNNRNKKCIIINLYIDDFVIENSNVRSRDKEKLLIRQENVKNAIFVENITELFDYIKK